MFANHSDSSNNTVLLSIDNSLITVISSEQLIADADGLIQLIVHESENVNPYESMKKNNENEFEREEKLSTLFNTTGRERNTTGPLKKWLYEHQDNPYPNDADKKTLMRQTQMTAAQITVWFANARVKMRHQKLMSNNAEKRKKKIETENSTNVDRSLQVSVVLHDQLSQLNIDSLETKRLAKKYVIAYSSLNNEQIIELEEFGSIFSDDVSISDCVDEHTTHLVIGKEDKHLLCPLTIKLFQSIARHLFVISSRWINDCLNKNSLINETEYEIRGDIPFDGYHDGMKTSRLSKHIQLFRNCHFFLSCDGCQNKMSNDDLISLIKLCHGSILNKFPLTKIVHQSILTIVFCDNTCPIEDTMQRKLFELSRSNGVHFLCPEWIFESIVHFSLQSFGSFEVKF